MEEKNFKADASILAKQNEAIHICYDRLLDMLRETTNETTIMKCIETIRKDMSAIMAPSSGKQNAITDTCSRVAEIEKQLKKL
ncbi:MAG: hypothetical protein IJ442_03730 [Bacteroidaceae bacterium]|nr:hypothetical protein [Bacteroidaceae bacterium]